MALELLNCQRVRFYFCRNRFRKLLQRAFVLEVSARGALDEDGRSDRKAV